MHIPLLVLASLMGCSERVVIPGRSTPSGRAWINWQNLLEDASNDEGVDYTLIDDNRFVLESFLRWAGQPWRKRCENRSCEWVKRSDDGPGSSHFDESDEDLALSYYINVFNAAAIYSIIEEQPEDSINDIRGGLAFWEGGGFWWGRRFRLDEEWVNLYYLQEQQIINRFQSPFPYIALNPGIVGGPPVRWWEPSNWDNRRLRTRHTLSVPRLGEEVTEAEFLRWFVNGGDWVNEGDAVAELQIPETTVVVYATRSGFITKRHPEVGQQLQRGESLADFNLSELETSFRESWTHWIDGDGAIRQTETGWAINASFLEWEDEIADWTNAANLCVWLADRASEPERQDWLRSQVDDCNLEIFETDMRLNIQPEPSTTAEG